MNYRVAFAVCFVLLIGSLLINLPGRFAVAQEKSDDRIKGRAVASENDKAESFVLLRVLAIPEEELPAGLPRRRGPFVQDVTSDAEGRFALKRFEADAFVFAESKNKKRKGMAKLSQDAKELEIKLQDTATFKGRLLDKKGNPIAGRYVEYSFDVRNNEGTSVIGTTGSGYTDEDGQFVLEGVTVGGPYTVAIVIGENHRTLNLKNDVQAKKAGEVMELGEFMPDIERVLESLRRLEPR
jgi:hypothetical protein